MSASPHPLILALSLAFATPAAFAAQIELRDNGQPVVGARIGADGIGEAMTDENGHAVLPLLGNGVRHIDIVTAAGNRYRQPIAVETDRPTTVELAQAMPAVVVAASALALNTDDMATPASVLTDDALWLARDATLGSTLSQQPGMAATHFGAGASRPIIRGMDGARVRVLSHGAEVMDASTISHDHAVSVEPMLTRQIEVLRGPSALAYGGGAIGGVVNLLDDKIPTRIPENGITGHLELRGASAAREGVGAFAVTGGSGNLAFHAEGLKRDARDYRVGEGWSEGSKVAGSYNQSQTGSLGASWIGEQGYVGLAYTSQRNEYGLPGHSHIFAGCHTHGDHLHCGDHGHDHGHGGEDNHGDHDGHDDHDEDEAHDHDHGVPYITLRSTRWDLRGEYREPFAGVSRLRFSGGLTRYRHDELEDGTVATRFKNKAHDGRLELQHHPIAGWQGVIGIQSASRDFSAVGEEAYLEPTETRSHSLFLLEEKRFGDWRIEAALRHDWQRITIDAAPRNRSHDGTSLSLGANWRFAPAYTLGFTFARTQRLPTAEELYANGLHTASSTYERGNVDLKRETAHNLDITLRKHAGPTTFSLSAYHNRIGDYIYASTLDELDGLQLIEYAQRDATFTGVEAQIRQQVLRNVGVGLFGDYVRAKLDGSADDKLPRIPAARFGTRLDGNWGNWNGEIELYRVARQTRVATFETETPGYNMVNLGISYRATLQGLPYLLYLKANNLADTLAYSHTSFIKHAAPLSGRNVMLGVRVSF